MGSVSLKIGDGTARFKRASICSSAVNITMLFSVITTNLFALYAFTYTPNNITNPHSLHTDLISEKVSEIMKEIEVSQKKLSQMEQDLLGYDSISKSSTKMPPELGIFLNRHELPLGKDAKSGMTEMSASIGHLCWNSGDLLAGFMGYRIYGQCPDDWAVGEKLVGQKCEPLPRRRCLGKSLSKNNGQVYPLPKSLWMNVNDKVVSWNGFGCRNFTCLNKKKFRDCVGCFDLSSNGFEFGKFVKSKGKNDFVIDDVLGLGLGGGGGPIRIGLDVTGNGSPGTFAARMWEKNVTIITQSLNIDAPFNEFIAARGLFPLYISLDYRFPFYDNFFDLVHVGSALDVGGKAEKMEFLLFDIDRVLRVGGLLWLDNYHCANDEKKRHLTQLIERFGFKKLKWVIGEKDSGKGKSEVYLSAVLQKPVRA